MEILISRNVPRVLTLAMKRMVNPLVSNGWIFSLTKSGREYYNSATYLTNFTLDVSSVEMELRFKFMHIDIHILGYRKYREVREKVQGPPSVRLAWRCCQRDLPQINSNPLIKKRKKEMLDKLEKGEELNEGKKPKSFLNLLVEEHIRNNSLSIYDIEEEVQTFLFAGHDTTSTGNSWTLYHLGRHPDILKKVQEEVDSILDDDRPITAEDLKSMKYLEMVIKVSLITRIRIPTSENPKSRQTKISAKTYLYMLLE
ncbi:CYP4V2 [Cordylochernes scorpioides]|uniref:CYP4V2 n=1 Tax=Cordylochernes scorpioides TaxID=51811 RepID=A0ABY6K465_9ARAC|nr:CYP4V2 [Cordylochernes scorpioides]